jgi:flagellar hook assembly protein FlgD
VNESLSPGYHTIIWDATNHDGKNVSAGIYYYTLEIGEFKESRKMTLLK